MEYILSVSIYWKYEYITLTIGDNNKKKLMYFNYDI